VTLNSVNVLALVTDAYGGHGGIAQYNRDFLGTLAEYPDVSLITIVARHAPDAVTTPTTRIEQLSAKRRRIAYAIAALRAGLFRHIDVVFCGHIHIAPLALIIARLARAKLIVQTHGIEVWGRPSWLRRVALERADMVLCVSRNTRAAVLAWTVDAQERAIVVPDTVSDDFSPGDGSKLRSALGLTGKRVLLTVGRMDAHERYKGHDLVIAALSGPGQKMGDVHYVIVGDGNDRGRLEALARSHKIEDRVHFIGAVDHETLIDAYRMADIFVMPSKGEGFGIAFLEAMASGTPVLGLSAGGARDALADGELGGAVTESELPDAICRLLSAPKPDACSLVAKVRARFGREVFAAQVHAVFDRLKAAA
jgi:phosphatidyl-myo-inositol dimannoside synthase